MEHGSWEYTKTVEIAEEHQRPTGKTFTVKELGEALWGGNQRALLAAESKIAELGNMLEYQKQYIKDREKDWNK